MEAKKRLVPCPMCHGDGVAEYINIGDGYGDYPLYNCGWCEGEGMYVPGGEIHLRRKAEKEAWKKAALEANQANP